MDPILNEETAITKKVVFIAHPLSGDLKENTQKILAICEQVHKEGVTPVAPYLVSLQYADNTIIQNEALGVEANYICLERGLVDELWLYGDSISSGMEAEILLAVELGIPIVAKTKRTDRDLKKLLTEREPISDFPRD